MVKKHEIEKNRDSQKSIKNNNNNQLSFKSINISFNSEEGSKSDKNINEEEKDNILYFSFRLQLYNKYNS